MGVFQGQRSLRKQRLQSPAKIGHSPRAPSLGARKDEKGAHVEPVDASWLLALPAFSTESFFWRLILWILQLQVLSDSNAMLLFGVIPCFTPCLETPRHHIKLVSVYSLVKFPFCLQKKSIKSASIDTAIMAGPTTIL